MSKCYLLNPTKKIYLDLLEKNTQDKFNVLENTNYKSIKITDKPIPYESVSASEIDEDQGDDV